MSASIKKKSPEFQNEQSFLLPLLIELSSVKRKEDLWRILYDKIKENIGFCYTTIYCNDLEHQIIYDFLSGMQSSLNKDLFKDVLQNHYSGKDNDFKIFLKQEARDQFKDGLVVNLRSDNTKAGYWVIVFTTADIIKDSQENSLTTVADQLSKVLHRLQSEEIIAKRESENEFIQSLNIDFAAIRDKKDLLRILQFKLKKLVDFGHQCISTLNEDQLTMSPFLLDLTPEEMGYDEYQQFLKAKYSLNDRIINKVILLRQAIILDLESLVRKGELPDYMQFFYKKGIKRIVMSGLFVGSRITGIWAFCLQEDQMFSNHQLHIITGICNPLSISVDNILVNTAILEKEKERELLLKLSYDVSTIRNKSDLVKVINSNLKKLFEFENIVIFVMNEDPA
ncbi:MAG TPA: hypothetical protein VKI61_00165, partial [Chitinophagaceae bacterium]|nr:hypothetical protein [Chitinophagaceae bacterium]